MRRLAALLVATATASVLGLAAAPAAGACTGTPCDEICWVYWQLGKPCPIR